ncbi:MAG: RsfS/YbeB/iojap family protein, partial [Chloroflexi bacterium]|nr:RsfS/YbeB/iojap family protein [Chloroflexota bacterium]
GWVLLDYGDLIVHVFSPEERDYYGLDEFWAKARPVLKIQ